VTPIDMGRALVAAVALERLAELAVSRRNARRLLLAGGVEVGRGHYPAMVAFHAALLAACFAEPALWPGPWPAQVAVPAAALLLLSQALRWWAVASLGGRWSTRVIALPGAAPVRSGPYRWLRHPNYLAVVVEVSALPLAAGAWRTAIAATVLNAALLAVRVRAEERALGEAWSEAFEGVGRFVPSPHQNPNLNPRAVPAARVPSPLARVPCSDPAGAWATGQGTGDRGQGEGDTGSGWGSGSGRAPRGGAA